MIYGLTGAGMAGSVAGGAGGIFWFWYMLLGLGIKANGPDVLYSRATVTEFDD